MLATGRYAQWQSRFLRYIDTRPNGDALRKCILEGPYQPTTVTIPAVPATENSPAIGIKSQGSLRGGLPNVVVEPAPRSPEYINDPYGAVRIHDVASALYHSLHPSGTPPLLPIPLPTPSTSRRADIPEADTPPQKRLLLTTPRPGCEIG
ncbi:hypothetical protein Tco_0179196 [Tanacetum coccineum]